MQINYYNFIEFTEIWWGNSYDWSVSVSGKQALQEKQIRKGKRGIAIKPNRGDKGEKKSFAE